MNAIGRSMYRQRSSIAHHSVFDIAPFRPRHTKIDREQSLTATSAMKCGKAWEAQVVPAISEKSFFCRYAIKIVFLAIMPAMLNSLLVETAANAHLVARDNRGWGSPQLRSLRCTLRK